jgi:predicted glycoside hydrolase/deacetylase ChbG (UPF0249 family)
VNADDLGRTVGESDAAIACWRAGGISSATHMVWMTDSDRAAALAREASVEVMTHPGIRDEYELLVSEDWRRAVAGLRQGSFSALP